MNSDLMSYLSDVYLDLKAHLRDHTVTLEAFKTAVDMDHLRGMALAAGNVCAESEETFLEKAFAVLQIREVIEEEVHMKEIYAEMNAWRRAYVDSSD